MRYDDSEHAWLDRRAADIARETDWPLPIARSEAAAQLTRGRHSGRVAAVVLLGRRQVRHSDTDDGTALGRDDDVEP